MSVLEQGCVMEHSFWLWGTWGAQGYCECNCVELNGASSTHTAWSGKCSSQMCTRVCLFLYVCMHMGLSYEKNHSQADMMIRFQANRLGSVLVQWQKHWLPMFWLMLMFWIEGSLTYNSLLERSVQTVWLQSISCFWPFLLWALHLFGNHSNKKKIVWYIGEISLDIFNTLLPLEMRREKMQALLCNVSNNDNCRSKATFLPPAI